MKISNCILQKMIMNFAATIKTTFLDEKLTSSSHVNKTCSKEVPTYKVTQNSYHFINNGCLSDVTKILGALETSVPLRPPF